jgi:glucose-1-phosphate thymidylyltransferase
VVETLKALILAAGKGTRLRPLTNTIAKHLIPVANKPILFYIMEQIQEAGIQEIGVVISHETGDYLKEALANGSKWDSKITYILQSEPLGLAHAVKMAQDFLGNSPFLLFLGDNLIKDGVKDQVNEFRKSSPDALIMLKEVPDPRAFGVAEVDVSGKVSRVVEKPKEPRSNLALVGAYIFKPVVHEAISKLKPSWRGEYEITDAIQALLDMGKVIKSHVLQGWWLDTGKKEDLLEANRIIMNEYLKNDIQGVVDTKSRISGLVEIKEGARIENCLIQGPVSIAQNCNITNSSIGPYTSIGASTKIENSTVEDSIILNNSHIHDITRLSESVIGRNVEVFRQEKDTESARLFVGDYARVEL